MYAIYTTELIESRKRRMPWRTVLELAKAWGAVVLSADGEAVGKTAIIDGVRVRYVNRPFYGETAQKLVEVLKEHQVTRLYFPIAPGRAYQELSRQCNQNGIELVWYIPSAWYSLGRVIRAARWIGFKMAKPYLIQALVPKRNWIRRLNKNGIRHLITMTPFTGRMMVKHGYPEQFVHPILPGVDAIQKGNMTAIKPKIGMPYFLFFGPPQAIRGIYIILEAVKRLAAKRRDFVFVPLIRGDENANEALQKLKVELAKPVYRDIVQPHFGNATKEEIGQYIAGCVAVLKPFVLVPSEVPLAVMEAMQKGKIVIGFDGDGTGELIGKYGIAVKHGSADALANEMNLILDCSCALEDINWFAWPKVAEKWREVI